MDILKHILILRDRHVRGVIFLCLLLSTGYMSFAACLGCFTLKGIRVEVANGDMVSGYACWNSAWFAVKNEEPIFPDSLFKSKYSKECSEPLIVYKEVYPIDKPLKDPEKTGTVGKKVKTEGRKSEASHFSVFHSNLKPEACFRP